MEPLDNPAWHALTGPQARFSEGTGLALRYEPDVSVFAALPDEPTEAAWDALRTLVGPGDVALLPRARIEPPAEWEVVVDMQGHQYVAPPTLGDDAEPGRFVALGPDDVPEMLALVAQTRPGPFRKRTVELGAYLGLRADDGTLVAMAGERMQPSGYVEVSAVCTDPAHRGKGLATALMHALAQDARARGDRPILHVAADNAAAIALYEGLGFTRRATLTVLGVRAPK